MLAFGAVYDEANDTKGVDASFVTEAGFADASAVTMIPYFI